jgi:hypothetical protein
MTTLHPATGRSCLGFAIRVDAVSNPCDHRPATSDDRCRRRRTSSDRPSQVDRPRGARWSVPQLRVGLRVASVAVRDLRAN